MLEREFNFFKEHQDEIAREHHGRFVVIVGEEVVDVYDTALEAYEAASQEHEAGTFLVQQALPGQDVRTQTFYSRVVFG